jgi:hypothetical protein
MPVEPGKTYTVKVEAYLTHGGKQFTMDAYIRPDKGDGYESGNAYRDGRTLDGDLCCLVFGDSHGQYVENQIRAEDWEIFIPKHRPTTSWGQTFVASGVSMGGVSFWTANKDDEASVECEVRIREEGPWGKILKPIKSAQGQVSAERPRSVYPEIPSRLPEYNSYYESKPRLFQVAWLPDELKLTPGKTYYIEVLAKEPIMMWADGHCYENGYAYYEGLKVERQEVGRQIFHSARWTLLMNIVTYAKSGGKP